MALIHCPFCGGYISDKAPVCPHCGYVMADGDVSSSTQESPKPPAPPVESGQPDATGPMPPEEPNPHKGHGMVWAIVIILVLLAAGGAAYYINAENKAEEEAAATRTAYLDLEVGISAFHLHKRQHTIGHHRAQHHGLIIRQTL